MDSTHSTDSTGSLQASSGQASLPRMELFLRFKEKLVELAHIKSALAVLSWDEQVNMPPKAATARAQTIASLAGLLHEKFLSVELERLLTKLKDRLEKDALNPGEAAIVREVWREFEREKKLPTEFVKELARITSEARSHWAEARAKSDFTKFSPSLKKIVELKREEAKLVGYKNSPYDALLDIFEPYATAEEISITLEELKDFLVPFLRRIKGSPVKFDRSILKGDFPIEKQIEFNRLVAEKIGYDLGAGRIDVSDHPFTTDFHPQDVRITTRYDKADIFPALMATIHETGHALYSQGVLAEHFGTPLGESLSSLGIHESQSRIWENLVGRSRPFWTYFYPLLQRGFPEPFSSISLDRFYLTLNNVLPSFTRVEADEVTYNLHIILRFEIEKNLIEGRIEVEDLPKIWNDKFKEYFDLEVPNDALGVLQDIHWSGGAIGYFPTYSLGNLYSAQFYAAVSRAIPDLEEKISRGEFGEFLEWLRQNIHIHGKLYTARDLVMQVTGEPLKNQYFIDYLEKKYRDVYNL